MAMWSPVLGTASTTDHLIQQIRCHNVDPLHINSPQKSSQTGSFSHKYAGEQGGCDISQDSTREFVQHISDLPITRQPFSDTVMRDMLVTLGGSLHRDMMDCVSHLKSKITAIGDRVSHVEDKMGEFASAHNELVDTHNETEEDMQAIKSKLADLEDRSHRKTTKLWRGGGLRNL